MLERLRFAPAEFPIWSVLPLRRSGGQDADGAPRVEMSNLIQSNQMNKRGTLIALILTLVGLSAMVVAFLGNSSPYVTVAEAKALAGDNLHLAGDIIAGTMFNDAQTAEVRFDIRDARGEVMRIVYSGTAPANMGEATKVVAIGGMEKGRFVANRLLIKCPSKYESAEKSRLPAVGKA